MRCFVLLPPLLLLLLIAVVASTAAASSATGPNNALRRALNAALIEMYSDGSHARIAGRTMDYDSNTTDATGLGLPLYPPRPSTGALADILSTGVARVAFGSPFKPYYWFDPTVSNATYSGVDVDLVTEALRHIGTAYGLASPIQLKQIILGARPPSYLYTELYRGTFHFSARFLAKRQDRQQIAAFTTSFWQSQTVLVALQSAGFASPAAVVSAGAAVSITGGAGGFYLGVQQQAFPLASIVPAATTTASLQTVLSGGASVAAVDREVALAFMADNNPGQPGNPMVIVGNMETLSAAYNFWAGWQTPYDNGCRAAAPQSANNALRMAINAALDDVSRAGTYAAIMGRAYQSDCLSPDAGSRSTFQLTQYPPHPSAGPLARILTSGVARVGFGRPFAPYYQLVPFTGSRPGDYSGLQVDLVEAVFNAIGQQYNATIRVEQVIVSTDADTFLSQDVYDNRFDVGVRYFNKRADRNQASAFTCASALSTPVVLTHTGAGGVQSEGDIGASTRIAVAPANFYESFIRGRWGATAQLVQVTGTTDGMRAVLDGRADMVIADDQVVNFFRAGVANLTVASSLDIHSLDPALIEGSYVAFQTPYGDDCAFIDDGAPPPPPLTAKVAATGSNDMRRALTAALLECMDDGTYGDLALRWQMDPQYIPAAFGVTRIEGAVAVVGADARGVLGINGYPERPPNGVLARVLERGYATVAYRTGEEVAPFTMDVSTVDGLSVAPPNGFMPELVQALLQHIFTHYQVPLVPSQRAYYTRVPYSSFTGRAVSGGIYDLVSTDRADFGAWPYTYRSDRAQAARLSTPVINNELAVGRGSSLRVRGITDEAGLRAAAGSLVWLATAGSNNAVITQSLFPGAQIRTVATLADAVSDLAIGVGDCYLGSRAALAFGLRGRANTTVIRLASSPPDPWVMQFADESATAPDAHPEHTAEVVLWTEQLVVAENDKDDAKDDRAIALGVLIPVTLVSIVLAVWAVVRSRR